jgi:hypothetical protein
MDDTRMHARNDATSLVARDFEPTRIERQLLARAFELLCEIQPQPTAASPRNDQLVSGQSACTEFDRRRVA